MWIVGVDEVGIGPLAGPIVAAAVMLEMPDEDIEFWPEFWPIDGVRDSKKMSHSARVAADKAIRAYAAESGGQVGIGAASVSMINRKGHQAAYMTAMRACVAKAIEHRGPDVDLVLVDGNNRISGISQEMQLCRPKADRDFFVVAAASVLAKVARDGIMSELGREHAQYGFEQHMGYPTEQHLAALDKHGLTAMHRTRPAEKALRNWRAKRSSAR